ncbi:hypothetical protein NFI96_028537 [Prochilodus magdalenae]|nr:hypothetical protein NFI96_028537 [Prochilodus magdalenae]
MVRYMDPTEVAQVVQLLKDGTSICAIATRFAVSHSTVLRVRWRFQETGSSSLDGKDVDNADYDAHAVHGICFLQTIMYKNDMYKLQYILGSFHFELAQNNPLVKRDTDQTSDSVESNEWSNMSDESSEASESNEYSSGSASVSSQSSESSSSEEEVRTTPVPDIIISQTPEEAVTTTENITCFTVLHTTSERRGDS